jgi:nitrogen-specific signal transduction histidine kinase
MALFNRTCKEVTRLILEGEDRRLSLLDRLAISLHMRICATCPRFLRQAGLMRQALGRWRRYRD